MNLDFALIENASLLAFALVFLCGIIASVRPCNVAMMPQRALVAYKCQDVGGKVLHAWEKE